MNISADIYTAIAGRLEDFPIDMLRLSLVCRAAYYAVSKVFPIALAERAIIEYRCKYDKIKKYKRIIPYITTCECWPSGYYTNYYKLKWGYMVIEIDIRYEGHAFIDVNNGDHTMAEYIVDLLIKRIRGHTRPYHIKIVSLLGFITRIFPGLFVEF